MQRLMQATRRIGFLGTRCQSTASSAVSSLASTGLRLDPAQLPENRYIDIHTATEEEYARTLVHGRSTQPPLIHPKTHGIPVASIHFRSYDTVQLRLFTHFALHAASSLGIPTSNVVSLPTQRTLWTVPRSPFAHKKSQENFERRTHKRLIKAWDADPEVIQRWIKYLRKHTLSSVGLRVTTWERLPLGLGAPTIIQPSVEQAQPKEQQQPEAIPASSST